MGAAARGEHLFSPTVNPGSSVVHVRAELLWREFPPHVHNIMKNVSDCVLEKLLQCISGHEFNYFSSECAALAELAVYCGI